MEDMCASCKKELKNLSAMASDQKRTLAQILKNHIIIGEKFATMQELDDKFTDFVLRHIKVIYCIFIMQALPVIFRAILGWIR